MDIMHPILLREIDAFLRESGMGPAYFGKKSCSNSELVARLRKGGRIWPETETKVRSFIMMHQREASKKKSKKLARSAS